MVRIPIAGSNDTCTEQESTRSSFNASAIASFLIFETLERLIVSFKYERSE